MQSKKRLIILLSVVLIISMLSFAPVQTKTAQAAKPGTSIVYNLYATDGFIPLADGSCGVQLWLCGRARRCSTHLPEKCIACW